MAIFDTSSATSGLSSGSKSVISQDKLQEDLNRFLNLLVTQLKNQDPLDPMDTNEFTSQLVGFAGVEQQINANATLEKLLAIQQTTQVGSMVSYLGTIIQAKGDTFYLEDDFAAFTYTLPTNAVKTTITIQDAAGQTVLTVDGETGAGAHGFTWDGTSAGGVKQPTGAYRAVVTATDAEGNQMEVEQTVFGRVTGGGIGDDGTVQLFMGDVETPLDSVISVNAPSSAAPSDDTGNDTDDDTTDETDGTDETDDASDGLDDGDESNDETEDA